MGQNEYSKSPSWKVQRTFNTKKSTSTSFSPRVQGIPTPHPQKKLTFRNVRVFTPQVALREERYLHKTFLDSLGRTAIRLSFENVVDEKRGTELVVVYEYPRFAGLRKVIVVAVGVLAVFVFRVVGGYIFSGGIGGK